MDKARAIGRRWSGPALLALGLAAFAATMPSAPALPHPPLQALWADWPLDPALLAALGFTVAVYLRGARRGPAVERPEPARIAAFLGGIFALMLALQSPVAEMAPHSFALDALAQLLLRTAAPALLAMANPAAALRRGLGAASLPAGALLRRLARPLPGTAIYVAVAYLWAWPAARDLALTNPLTRAAMDISLLGSGLCFFGALFDPRPEPASPTIGTQLLMVWGAELANVLLGYYLTYTSFPLYSAYAAHGLLWGVTPFTNEVYGGQTWWLCDTALIGLAAMVAIHRWARRETRPAPPDPAALRASQRASNRLVLLGLLGFVGVIVGIMGAGVVLYEVAYHRGVRHAPAISVNQIP